MANHCDRDSDFPLPFSYSVVTVEGEPCDRQFGVVLIDDVPVGTGRIDERGQIVDVEWSAAALTRLGLSPEQAAG